MTNAQTVKTELTTWQQFKQLKGWMKFFAGYGMFCSFGFIMNVIIVVIKVTAS